MTNMHIKRWSTSIIVRCDIVIYNKKYIFGLLLPGTELLKPLEFPERRTMVSFVMLMR